MKNRTSGILTHITSLPGSEGIGTLGNDAFRFIDFLSSTNQKVWQILPLGPVGYGDSHINVILLLLGMKCSSI